ncbi:Oxygen-evolving enhancer protein 3-2, chloroplastic [Quillaja saponaria]|uniref:Oxygen-evolving enhancer protein 3-2, chloroplastic n=1 Tax=Quillaja saponaria TaxID=32244 RepID=A0AAD7PV34_QUISA|nr:Oxygen-evolving enhancer protein 3-2, chloroplastic [Quillaja saponaria]
MPNELENKKITKWHKLWHQWLAYVGSSQAVFEGNLQLSGSTCLTTVSSNSRVSLTRLGLTVRTQQVSAETETSRRGMLGLVAAGLASGSFVQAVLAEAKSIKVGPPPPPAGGLPRTLNADEARDLELPLKERAEYLRFDLNTVISAKSKVEKNSFKELTGKLFRDINNLDFAAKVKSTPQAEKCYAETVSTLNDVVSKLG